MIALFHLATCYFQLLWKHFKIKYVNKSPNTVRIDDNKNVEQSSKTDSYSVEEVAVNLTLNKFTAIDLGAVNESTNIDQSKILDSQKSNLCFDPPVYVQRYTRVCNILENEKWKKLIKKVVEFGCSEMKFFTMVLKRTEVEEVIEVDIDNELLNYHISRINPTASDFLFYRKTPLSVKVFTGNVAHINDCLLAADAVVAIELIEHLYPYDLEALPFTIFGFIQPLIAVFTTPNADFNILFPNFSGFRHYDHKFEWTRKQFEDWCHNLILRYPEYEVSFEGVGDGPKGTEGLGSCSQLALFVRKSSHINTINIADYEDLKGEYKLVDETKFPLFEDNRSDEKKLLDAAESLIYKYWFRRKDDDDIEFTFKKQDSDLPLELILADLDCFCLEKLRGILVNAGWDVYKSESGRLKIKLPESSDELEFDDTNCEEFDDNNCEVTGISSDEENWDDIHDETFLFKHAENEKEFVALGTHTDATRPSIKLQQNLMSTSDLSNPTHYSEKDNSFHMPVTISEGEIHNSSLRDGIHSVNNDSISICDIKYLNSDKYFDSKTVSQDISVDYKGIEDRNLPKEEYLNQSQILNLDETLKAVKDTLSDKDIPQKSPISLSEINIENQMKNENSSLNLHQKFDPYESVISGYRIASTPFNTPNMKRNSCDAYIFDIDSAARNTVGNSDENKSNITYLSCAEDVDSDVFFTPRPVTKSQKKPHAIPSFNSAFFMTDFDNSDDLSTLSDSNISFKSVKQKCNSCPSSRQSISAEDLVRGASYDISVWHHDSASTSKAPDSGYPISSSEHYMDMDLTPEQVCDLFTESDSSLGCDDEHSLPQSPVNPNIGQIIPLIGDNVENGDVANNNRDGEGNNVLGIIDGAVPIEFAAIINEQEVHPLLAAVENDFDSSDNELPLENKIGCNSSSQHISTEDKVDLCALSQDHCEHILKHNKISPLNCDELPICDISKNETYSNLECKICSTKESSLNELLPSNGTSDLQQHLKNEIHGESNILVSPMQTSVQDFLSAKSESVQHEKQNRENCSSPTSSSSISDLDSTQEGCTFSSLARDSYPKVNKIHFSLPSSNFAIAEEFSQNESEMTIQSDLLSFPLDTVSLQSDEEIDSNVQELPLNNEVWLPEHADPFPPWLLMILNHQYDHDDDSEIIEMGNVDFMIEDEVLNYDVQGDMIGGGDSNLI
uniref:Small RNA 2'-O-methyltransferase n=1 Tax=Clastoptera arizonana TaxID=38151 RepID=A0A1B6D6X4_9HEMI